MTETPRLWEANHPYHCNDSNYRVAPAEGGNVKMYESWVAFLVENGDSDPDYNLVFRWDWKKADPDDYDPDIELPQDVLHLYVVHQRRGDFWVWQVGVTDADEPAVRAWLTDRAKTITAIWAPISLTAGDAS